MLRLSFRGPSFEQPVTAKSSLETASPLERNPMTGALLDPLQPRRVDIREGEEARYTGLMILESFPVGSFQCNCVVLGDEATREAIVIDPGDDIDRITEILDHYRLTVRKTLHTHGHLDHIGAAGQLKLERGAAIHIHRGDLPLWQSFPRQAALFGVTAHDLPEPDAFLLGGEKVAVGSIVLEVIETPGHTPGSVCLSLVSPAPGDGPLLFSGDTLFRRGIGRTDLWGGDYATILEPIRDRIFRLPGETIVHPGHGPVTSVHDERAGNPFRGEILANR